MKTSEALFKQFGTKFPPAETVNRDFIKLSDKEFRTQALKGPVGGIRFFTIRERGPMFADIEQMAEALDNLSRG